MNDFYKKNNIDPYLKILLPNNVSDLINEGIISKNNSSLETLNIKSIFEVYLNLLNDNKYEEQAIDSFQKIITTFSELYPDVKIDNLILRRKSANSLMGKIKNLEIERISKLYAIKGDVPDKVEATSSKLFRDKLKSTQPYTNSNENVQSVISSYKNQDLYNKDILNFLISERIINAIKASTDEKSPEEISEMKSLVDEQQHFFIEKLHELLDFSQPINYDSIATPFFTDFRFNISTKKAIARILYYRIKTDSVTKDKNGTLIPLNNDETRLKYINNFKESAKEELAYDSILKSEQDSPEWNQPCFASRYNSRLERILEPNEFLLSKDFYGMQIIIDDIPEFLGRHINNDSLHALILAKSFINDKDSEEYKDATQKCINIVCNDFINNLSTNSQNNPILDNLNAKLIPDSIKHKSNANHYIADHAKIEFNDNPVQTFEVQMKSKEVFSICSGDGLASHSKRFGKKRVFPDIIENDNITTRNITDEQYELFKKQLTFLLPEYYSYDTNTKTIHKFTTPENCMQFYEDFKDDKASPSQKQAFNKLLEFVDYSLFRESNLDKFRANKNVAYVEYSRYKDELNKYKIHQLRKEHNLTVPTIDDDFER